MTLRNETPSFAVLLAAYNGRAWISEQINSILDQENVNVSVFVSVDASTDGTENIVASIADLDSRVRLLPYGMRFGGAGPNFYRLISDCDFSRFDAVALSDQDDIWFKTKLSKAWRIMQENRASVVSSNVIAFWPDGKRKFIKKSYKQREMDYFFEAAGPGCTYVFDYSTMMAFKQFLLCNSVALNGIDLHDWLAYAFCRHNGYRWVIDREPSMLYRQHANNQVGTNTNIKAYLKRLDLIKSHWYSKQVNLIATLVAPDIDQRVTSLGFMLRNFNQLRRKPSERFILIVMRILGLF